jgi:uncharacterized protein YndB with AHSA1/START domain
MSERNETMHSIKQEIRIKGSVRKVYDALTRQSAYRGWWNKAGEIPETVGAEVKLHFVKDGQPVAMRYRIDEMKPDESVRWTCIGHDMPSWVGTTLNWKLAPQGEEVVVSFEHAGWKDTAPDPVVQGWRHFLGSLKSYVETGTGEPW